MKYQSYFLGKKKNKKRYPFVIYRIFPVPEMSATGLAYAADICGLPRKSLRKLAYVRRCPLQIRRCPCLCQSLRTFADIFPYQLGLSFCGRPQLYAS